jgi:superfamily I DNA and RNA helicase
MSYQLEQLKAENHAAENDFQSAVMNYLLNPLESTDELQMSLSKLFESVTRYRIALRKLREHLDSVRESESTFSRQASIEQAITTINLRDAALERLLKKIGRLAADQAARSIASPASR